MPGATKALDRTAVGVSVLCAVHCLVLPIAAAMAPLGIIAHAASNEWHWLFVVIALPVSGFALWQAHRQGTASRTYAAFICVGLALLISGLLPSDHDWQVLLTLAGAVTLAAGHVRQLKARHNHQGDEVTQ